MEKRKTIDELILENQKLASKIIIAHQAMKEVLIKAKKQDAFQSNQREELFIKLINENKLMSEELALAHKQLDFQNKEKAKRIDELVITNVELDHQYKERAKRADELAIANVELDYQNKEKAKRADELAIANVELDYQNKEKAKRADELAIANVELDYQNKEKAKRADELEITNKELEKFVSANRELKQFVYIASHEFKEPLRTIANFIQIINEDYSPTLDKKIVEYLRTIDNSVKRMMVLITSLLHFSRLGINKKVSNVDCKELIDSVISDLAVLIKSSNATIEVSEMPKINIYEIEFRQIFQNLITNAIKYQKKGSLPKIQIRAEKTPENYRFSVSDNGIGIEPSYFDRIFDIFQRLHNTEEVFEGKGIGLAYCKKIVQLHKGEIWVESELGKGSTFYFTIFPILSL
jgi:signal transduction histidine kinase